jgi:hypothetical protein
MKVNYWVMGPLYAIPRLNKDGSYFYGSAAMREIAQKLDGLTRRVIDLANLLSATPASPTAALAPSSGPESQ